jgi:HlyD family secretion protein
VDNQQAALRNAQAAVQAATADINDQRANLAAARANEDAAGVARDDARDLVTRDQELKDVVPGRDVEAAQAEADGQDARYHEAASQVEQAQASLREAEAKLGEAKAGVAQAQAELDQARVNLDHAIITSPIDGVVVSRNVDVGQTVAASLQAPILFVVANDLNNMQVLAAIDEADVGQIHEGIPATFSVDAYPGEQFSGRISQIRLNAQNLQNVVTYSAVIDTANTDQKLLPGMTANITVPVAHTENVLTVPNAALRFKPDHPQAAEPQDGQAEPDHGAVTEPGPSDTATDLAEGDNQNLQSRTIWVLKANSELEPRQVKVGITNGRLTAIPEGNLSEGEVVVIGLNDAGPRGG